MRRTHYPQVVERRPPLLMAEFVLEASVGHGQEWSSRRAGVRGMEEFGEKYRLSLGEPITRKLLHEGHR
jgi:hypothetical protein